MATHQEKVTAGLFLLLGIGLSLAVLFLIAGIQISRGMESYYVYFEGSIGNLRDGSPVKFMGVPVGTVGEMTLSPDLSAIEVELKLKKGTRVTEGTRARLKFNPLTSVYFVELNVRKGEMGEDIAPGYLIKAEKTEVDEIVSQLPRIQESIQTLLTEVISLLDEENRRNFSEVLLGLNELIQGLNDGCGSIRETFLLAGEDFRGTLKEVDDTLAVFREEAGGFRQDARLSMEKGIDVLKESAESLESGVDRFNVTFEDMDMRVQVAETSEALVRLIERLDSTAVEMQGVVKENRQNLKELVLGLEGLTREMRSFIARLDRDPSRLIWSTPKPERETPE